MTEPILEAKNENTFLTAQLSIIQRPHLAKGNMQRLSADEISASIEKLRHAIFSKANTTQLSKRQRASLKDSSVVGQSWVSRVTFTAPHAEENDARQLLVTAIERLGCGNEEYTLPSIEDVNAQWTGFRPGATLDEAQPSISEKEKYENLMNDVRSEMTIFYIQGGAFVFAFPHNVLH